MLSKKRNIIKFTIIRFAEKNKKKERKWKVIMNSCHK